MAAGHPGGGRKAPPGGEGSRIRRTGRHDRVPSHLRGSHNRWRRAVQRRPLRIGRPARGPALDASVQPAVKTALVAFVDWVTGTWGSFGLDDPPAWDPTRLAYAMGAAAGAAAQGTAQLTVEPDTLAELDWFASTSRPAYRARPRSATTSVIPGHVRFRGMPDSRWWVFEGSKTDFGAIVPDARNLARLLFMDFMLLHGDDWFLAPLSVPAGSLCFIDSFTVTDVFGVARSVPEPTRREAGRCTPPPMRVARRCRALSCRQWLRPAC